MPPPSSHSAFALSLLARPFSVVQLNASEDVPSDSLSLLTGGKGERFVCITRTKEEVSIVLESETDDPGASWRCIKIAGPMDFGIVGVICNFTTPLKAAGIPVFAVSTWNTDYILVPREECTKAVDILKEDGWTFLD